MAIIELAGIRVVVFDLDDTLYPERSYAFSGFAAVGKWLAERYAHGFEAAQNLLEDPEERPAGSRSHMEGSQSHTDESGVHTGLGMAAERMRELFDTPHRSRVFDQVLRELGIDPTPELVKAMVGVYREHRPTISLFPDAEEALRRWTGVFRLGLISDGPLTAQRNKVEALGLAGRLDRVILTDAWGQTYWKPHARAFEEIEKSFNWRESACIYIADNVRKDFVAPRQLGWRTARIRRLGGTYDDAIPPPNGEAEIEVASLGDLALSS